ncbi:sensor histidine kinase [Kitasatospora camelliae]|uniref:Histidine kinase n=1 Tax=Kitasatospora camelliae TaxID=3156397 RepID=A0AAU8K429_9ACTN
MRYLRGEAASSGERAEDRPPRVRDVPAPRLARSITVFALFCFSLIAFNNVIGDGARSGELAVLLLSTAAVFGIQLVNSSSRARRWNVRRRMWMLAAQAVLTVGPALFFGASWGGMLGCLAGSALLLVRGPAAWLLFVLSACGAVTQAVLTGLPLLRVIYVGQSSVLTGLVIYGLTRLADLVEEVHASRAELARVAVAQERLRFARDLHDLLGYSISAITLKTELIHRLVGVRPDRAREEIAGVLDISRQALADVRLVASGYRDMSLAAEADSAASTLKAAEIEAEVAVDCGRLHPLVDTVLATALREGITNILRHSKVQRCTITATTSGETVLLRLVNDGVVAQRRTPAPHSGSGIGNLRTRLATVGGRVEAGIQPDGRFQLLVEAPIRPQLSETATPRPEAEAAVA